MNVQRPGYDAAQRHELERRLRERPDTAQALHCPACDMPLAERPVAVPPRLPYVRRRVWLICPGCRRSAAVEAD